MENRIRSIGNITGVYLLVACLLSVSLLMGACKDSFLEEIPLDRFSPENLLVDEAGFEAATVALYRAAREEHALGGVNFDYMSLGTDLVEWGRPDSRGFKDYNLLNSQFEPVLKYWDWAYRQMVRQSNLILDNLETTEGEIGEEARMNFSGQAKFFRAYAYNVLVNLYGGVPIVSNQVSEPKFDFRRASKLEVLQFIQKDLEEAGVELPAVVNESNGRIYKAAAYHLLSEVYISLGMETGDESFYDRAIEAASTVIDGQAGHYQLMTNRFGDLSREGDVFSDLFWTNQQNRASGNLEVIFSWQFEDFTLGGGTGDEGINGGNNHIRLWAPEYDRIRTPNGVSNIPTDSLQRGIGVMIPLDYLEYEIWQLDPDDMRNSKHNIRRVFFYDNPADPEYFGKPIYTAKDAKGDLYVTLEDGTFTDQKLDTLRQYYPWFRKIDGEPRNDDVTAGRTSNEIIVMRLAETYLLRAEAYFRKGDLERAAADINMVRSRANAKLISAQDVSIDFLLDERARELVIEEPRRRTLTRMGVLYERVKKYNYSSAGTVQPHNELWPIPQPAIDSNTGVVLEQNPGYNG